jgi:hypothetical protein
MENLVTVYKNPNMMETIEPIKINHTFADEINKPGHYWKGGIDVIGFAELHFPKEQLKGFFRINSLKYLDRYEEKGGVKDLKKAKFYLDKLIALEEQHD